VLYKYIGAGQAGATRIFISWEVDVQRQKDRWRTKQNGYTVLQMKTDHDIFETSVTELVDFVNRHSGL